MYFFFINRDIESTNGKQLRFRAKKEVGRAVLDGLVLGQLLSVVTLD